MYADHTLNGDEGVVLNAAWQMWQGKQLYIDFVDFTAPGSAYSIYWTWKLFGEPSYLTAKLFSLALLGIATFCLSKLVYRETKNTYLTGITAIVWIILARFYPSINHNTYSSLAAIVTLYGLWQVIGNVSNKQRYYWVIFTGIMSAVVVWYLQTKGVAILLAVLLSLVAYKKYQESVIAGVSAAISLVILLWPWTLTQLWQSWVQLPLQSNYLVYTIIWWPVLIIEAGLIMAMLYITKHWSIKRGYVLVVWQVALWGSAGYLIDTSHLLINSFPLVILVMLWLNLVSNHKPYAVYSKALHGLVLSIPIFVFSTFNLISGNNMFALDMFHTPNSGWRTFLALGEQVDSIYAGPFLPSIYFELRKPNPFTAANNMVLCNMVCQQITVATLEQVQPDYALLDYALVEKYHYQATQPIDRYIQEYYSVCDNVQLGGLKLYNRTGARVHCPQLAN